MADRPRSIPELPALTTLASDDLILVVDTSAANTAKKATTSLINGVIAKSDIIMDDAAIISTNNLVLRGIYTPDNSTSLQSVSKGTIFFDTEYLYIAIDDNYVKRVALSDF